MEKNTKEKILYVDGMHCASCEILIEKALIKKDGIESVDVSMRNAQVRAILREDTHLNTKELDKEFAELGYRFSNHPIGKPTTSLFNRKNIKKNLLLITLLLIAFVIVEKAQLGRFVSIEPGATLSAFFFLGLVAGISSCAALIGGLLLSLTKHWHEQHIDAKNNIERAQPHILFHVGRLVAFFVFGGILGLAGNAITLNNTVLYATLVIIVSVTMFILALQMLNVEWAKKFIFKMPKSITRKAARDTTSKNKLAPFTTGALTFFLPCGFTLIAQGVALASGSFMFGALVMLYFAFGTLPILLGISFSGLKLTSKPHLTARFSSVAGVLILFFALYNINGQMNVLGAPSLSDIKIFQSQPSSIDPSKIAATKDGEQIISLIARDFDYIANGPTTIKSGIPTKLVVDDQGILGCGSYLASRGLINGFVPLKLGENVIDLGTPKPGNYKITCSMGMVRPVVINVQ